MPPHSEVEINPLEQPMEHVGVRQRKRSRSISTEYLTRRRSSGKTSRSSRSSSASSEVRESLPLVQHLAIVKASEQTPTVPVLVTFHEAPSFLQFNPFIYRGYRANICAKTCLKSLFWWTNETLNAWTHLLGWVYFAYFTVYEVIQYATGSTDTSNWDDNILMIMILVCFQICMALSTGYHVFCCHSQDFYHCWLSYDLCGISFSLLAIYTTGIYYAFWCQHELRTLYIGISFTLFVVSLIIQTTPKFLTDDYNGMRLVFFVSWSTFGFLPCLHWVYQNGGFTQHVFDLVSQIGIMYLICGAALFFYVTKIPEIWFPGSVDYIGSSHQWWHIIIFLAFYHWHNTGRYFSDFRARHGCFEQTLLSSIEDTKFNSSSSSVLYLW